MRFTCLPDWLQWQENLHFTEIDPGLDRINAVWQKMGRSSQLPFKIVTVAGTNGKGSSVALSSAILQAAGYKVATYTSPHLLRYNERMCINGKPCEDDVICNAFQRIDDARDTISLTYFEYATLAAMDIFIQQKVDIAILEVGMGGRLDAVNMFDTDIALITPIALDHIQWLGDNREDIGREKAGIIRSGKPVVISGVHPPKSITTYADSLTAPIYVEGDAYQYSADQTVWNWTNGSIKLEGLPYPALAGQYQLQNSAAVLQVCYLLTEQGLVIPEAAIRTGLQQVKLAGRFQIIPGPVTRILDVTHNQQGAENLKALLSAWKKSGQVIAVLAMLRDKDSNAVVTALSDVIDKWFVAGLDGSRSLSCEMLMDKMAPLVPSSKLAGYSDVPSAYYAAMSSAQEGDTVLVFGSFHTVEQVMRLLPEFSQS